MIFPAGHRILVEQEEYVEHDEVLRSAKRAGIEIVQDKSVRYQESVDKGVILAIGPTAWKDFGGVNWAEVGDTVVFAKHAGKRVEDPENDKKHLVILNDEDVVAIVRKNHE